MRIAVTSTGQSLDDAVEARFGRCPYFMIIDPETLEFEAIPNPNLSLGGGAGIQSAQLMADKGVAAVLTGNCGPNAFRTFGAAGIKVITGVNGRVREAVEHYKTGKLNHSPEPNVQSHFGMGRGMGKGGGAGGGLGRSMAPGTGFAPSNPSQEETMTSLKKLVTDLKTQIEMVESKIKDLEKK